VSPAFSTFGLNEARTSRLVTCTFSILPSNHTCIHAVQTILSYTHLPFIEFLWFPTTIKIPKSQIRSPGLDPRDSNKLSSRFGPAEKRHSGAHLHSPPSPNCPGMGSLERKGETRLTVTMFADLKRCESTLAAERPDEVHDTFMKSRALTACFEVLVTCRRGLRRG
jgi:hypothetical protein